LTEVIGQRMERNYNQDAWVQNSGEVCDIRVLFNNDAWRFAPVGLYRPTFWDSLAVALWKPVGRCRGRDL